VSAWTCPACGRGVAPSEKTCDHGGQVDLKGREFVPLPYVPSPTIVPRERWHWDHPSLPHYVTD